ncbi:MAG TPA: DNA recombination protein RmuC [Opitutaceae bacterium]|nr:DNA recombination protein RmuC [Opitutaceae bacterium]
MSTTLIVVLAAAVAAILVWLWAQSRSATLAERVRLVASQLARAEADLAALRAKLSELEAEKSRLDTLLTAERDALQQAQTKLTDTFKALAADALRGNNDEFLKRAGESLVKPVADSLKDVRDKIAEMEKTRASAYGSLSEQLKTLALAQTSLQTETTKLSTALSTTKTAGTWGELQLRRVVELAGMVEHCDFSEQESAGGQRPDLIVHLPRGQQIVVDAKAPTDAFREAAAAADPKVRSARLAEHAAKVRGHVDALSAKAYWEQFQPSPEFVVLFLPGDQFLAAALEADPALLDRAIRSRVLPVTPSTLIALLKAAAYGWRQESVSQNAEEISELGRQLADRIATYVEHFERVGHSLESATKSYNAAVGSLEGMVLPGARKFAELGAKGAKDLPEIGPVETAPRDITKRG